MSRRQRNTHTNFGGSFNYNPLFGGFGIGLNYETSSEEVTVVEAPAPAPAITALTPPLPAITAPQVAAIAPPPSYTPQEAVSAPPRSYREVYRGESSSDERYRGSSSRDERYRGSSSRDEGYRGSSSRDEGYRGSSSRGNPDQSNLIAFYKNEMKSGPNGDFIENIINNWCNDYERLDNFNSYIQWTFPGRVQGKNPQAPLLTDKDIQTIKFYGYDQRALRAFAMMVKFYGMEVQDCLTIVLAPNHKERLQKIMSHGKYYFVITRILSFLKELGEQTLMVIWLKLLADLIQKNMLDEDAKISFNSYWIKTLDNNGFREVKEYIRRINGN